MDVFNVLSLVGGLSLFLFGMNIMGQALESRTGGRLRFLLGKITESKWTGLLTGLGITAVIQSSSATTVMVVGFVNSGLMTLKQSINVIMGANIGTTVTSWILSLAGIDSGNLFIKLLKPASFTPVLAFIGIILYIFCKDDKKKYTGMILLGFSTLMFGMETMSNAVSGLGNIPEFQKMFLMFTNPILGVLAGAVLTAIIQSSSASVGILQVLALTGQITYGAAVPIIMGQNIGTCVTALISSIGANKNAKRAAMVHLSFNLIGTFILLTLFFLIRSIIRPALLRESASLLGIAMVHSMFNLLCTIIMLPMGNLLEKLVCKIIPDTDEEIETVELDERLLATPSLALERCRMLMEEMAKVSVQAINLSLESIFNYTKEMADSIRKKENQTDHYEDILGTYLVKLSACKLSNENRILIGEYLKIIGDYERIADHSVNLLESAEEIISKEIQFSDKAKTELSLISEAISEILSLSYNAFLNQDVDSALHVEPLEEVIDNLKEELRTRHILRLQEGNCSINSGYILSDLLTNIERVGDHCSNIAGCVIDASENSLNLHETLNNYKINSKEFKKIFTAYSNLYSLSKI